MKEKIEDKLEEIINKYQIHTSIGIKESIDVCDEWDIKTMGVAINEISTLIQEERKEAVEGFITDFIETGVYEGVGSIEDIMKLWRKYNAHN